MQILILLSLVVSSLALLGFGTKQSVAVKGKLICDGKPAVGVKVKLYEKEACMFFVEPISNGTVKNHSMLPLFFEVLDVKMAEGTTDRNGEFLLSGYKTEISTIDPKVNIYHKCNHKGLCYRKFGITIPDDYITKDKKPKKTYDIGVINLANKFTGETTDCIN
ncbi:Transthyretin-like family protein [Ancylostoma ceylanicum]|uniref:Transthyretin-like family protein n=2 Tax=Ancylostoma ceylanicum TaxID=53326 RepID=A0A0D6L7G1_9BILA|nr:Transthyretin-like family protein [Ancylostoma ceylanicum]EYC27706.1 hypothetical protein Y032_0008g141 [Ancylostoma ceylanicum]